MLEIYLGKNTQRNQRLMTILNTYGLRYTYKCPSQLTKDDVLHLFMKAPDCFELLSPKLLRYKRYERIKVSELVGIILKQPENHLRLPLVVTKNQVFPDISPDELRTFIPREIKRHFYINSIFKDYSR
ncbi:TPA: hypothetical protein ACGM4G_000485 [Streptococcus agalactiae]|uniref:Arsenate reductase n=1 Tax=Streptococcus dysgalactiae subsp. equisimilis TaxID=119602 RepID=A0AB38Y2Y5_STREQ|nr:hypothetical protein [Streptococcus dysgalactiae]EHG13675.1 hypothetical protein HMPREF9682_00665 [Streptococcus intermedius F0395]WHM79633.1 hypothetical protein OPT59_02730 [Streptococcus dysgalactiae subsp. equisimilis]